MLYAQFELIIVIQQSITPIALDFSFCRSSHEGKFVDIDDIKVRVEDKPQTECGVIAIVRATYKTNNELCDQGFSDQPRKKRSTDSPSEKDVNREALNDASEQAER